MTRVQDGALVVGPWELPLTVAQREVVDAMRVEAACQELATCEIKSRSGHYTFTVALRPTRQTVEAT